MKNFAATVEQASRTLIAALGPVFSIVLVVLIAATLTAQLGFRFPLGVRVLNPTELAYLCGAVWLWRKATS